MSTSGSGLSSTRRAVFTAIAGIAPLVLLAVIELVLRLTWTSAATPLFVPARVERSGYLAANRQVARRWFLNENSPPAPVAEAFAARKPAHGLRIFALGESTTAGFPYPPNGTFSRLLQDVLRDVLPSDSVEVINLGIPATNSYALLDEAGEIIAQHPDAVLIYAGHNEYYGALGAGSTDAVTGSPALVRAYLALQRLRIVHAVQLAVSWVRRRNAPPPSEETASFMETLARDQTIPLNGSAYERGERQFAQNLDRLLRRFRDANVRVFIASQASNIRDLSPLASPANALPGGADSTYAHAQAALAIGDSAQARSLFARARDLDVVRFRAPSAFNAVIRTAATANGAVYVPVAEAFDSASHGMPGNDLFLEHVHPNVAGISLIARTFYDALRRAKFLGRHADETRLKSWQDYVDGMMLTSFDERVAHHRRQTLVERWPFVAAAESRSYRAEYRPSGVVDSLSFLVSRGLAWIPTKLQLAKWYESVGQRDSAVAELRGVARDEPLFEEPWELAGRAAMNAGMDSLADAMLRHALSVRPTASAASAEGALALRRKEPARAVEMFSLAARLDPRPDILYQLSLAYGLTHDIARARVVAARLYRVAPNYPGLDGWMRVIGLAR